MRSIPRSWFARKIGTVFTTLFITQILGRKFLFLDVGFDDDLGRMVICHGQFPTSTSLRAD